MNISFILLQAAAQPQGSGNMFVWLILIFVVMWIMMIGPQRKQRKKEEAFRSGLKKGDSVTFSGGIYGKIHEVGETTVEVEVSHDVIITVEKNMLQPDPRGDKK